jgi:FAD/FMN-containing dehydrogenase
LLARLTGCCWLHRAWVAKYSHQTERYNGYISYDDQVPDYFQNNYARLRAVKKRYDPLNVFHNVLSVPAAESASSAGAA